MTDVKRIGSLDSLRGLAAFAVLISHCIHLQPVDSPVSAAIGRAGQLMGKDAVLIFFVLSGFVLFLSFPAADRFAMRPYLVKRVTRIWPPFAFAILCSALLYVAVQPVPIAELNPWFNMNWRSPPSPGLILKHLAMTDRTDWQSLDVVMWSLVYEMRISFVFPLLALAVARDWRLAVAASVAISVVALAFHTRFVGWFTPLSALRYFWLFAVGAGIALHAGAIRGWFARRTRGERVMLWLMAVGFLLLPFQALENITTPLASIAVVILCFADARADRALSTPALEWLGRVSYSLYLIHVPILLTLTHLLYGHVPMAVLLVLIVAAAVGAAHVMYRWVERPAMAVGRRWAQPASTAAARPPG